MVDMLRYHLQLIKAKQNVRSWCTQIFHEDKTFIIYVYCKPTFSEVDTHFDSFLPFTYKFCTVFALAHRYFRICINWAKLHTELVCLKYIFLKNGYPENFINKCFKRFMDNIHVVKETTVTVEKNSSVLVLPCLGFLSLQTRVSWRSH